MNERVNRYLASCGLGSRRDCDELVRAGRVLVNGRAATLGTRIAAGDTVQVDGRPIAAPVATGVWILHKPAGIVSTADDDRGRRTVLDLARDAGITTRIYPIGRLDLDTTGLLLLTNDGDLAFRLTHPAHGVEKEYEATVDEPLGEAELESLRTGIVLEDGPTSPCRVAQERRDRTWIVRLVLHEGRKRQVRRMLFALGHPVRALHRLRVGTLLLGDLPPGALRPATSEEIAALRLESEPRPPGPPPGLPSR